ncbi:MAG: queuosine precursor transporter, partial [Chitinophagaceae bacterium]
IKKITGQKKVWLRATGSTFVSQLVDSFIVLFIAFKLGNNWSWQKVLAICMMNYTYKFAMALILTPVIYLIENRIDKYIGHERSVEMKKLAMGEN